MTSTADLSMFDVGDVKRRATKLQRHDTPNASVEERNFDPAHHFGDHVIEPRLTPLERHRPAAVLIPLINRASGLSALLTQRTATLSKHAGQIAFPGGKIDANDKTAADAALREANEEIDLDLNHVEIIGNLIPYLSGSGYHITAVVGIVDETATFVANPGEVADVFEVPFTHLMSGAHFRQEVRHFEGFTRNFYSITYNDRYIWGITAGIIYHLHKTLYPELTV